MYVLMELWLAVDVGTENTDALGERRKGSIADPKSDCGRAGTGGEENLG